MKAMILAAGVGSRLRPLTDTCPKALIDINGQPMLEIVLRRLILAGCRAAVINVFHLAEQVVAFLKARGNFGIEIEFSRETELLDTGGGLKKVAAFFDDGHPFILHNVDVISNIDLKEMIRFHTDRQALATLAVQSRQTSRRFLFDSSDHLCGWESLATGERRWACEPVEGAMPLAFGGIHVISPAIFPKMSESGAFSINQTYLRLAGRGEVIQAFRTDGCYWRDIGRLQMLEAVRREAQETSLPLD